VATIKGAFQQSFKQQGDYFRRKLAIPSEKHDDIRGSEHDHAFIVAGATKADLVHDVKTAIQKVIDEGKSINWFREHFDEITQKHGWTGWAGEDSKEGRAWRTKTIFTTNLKMSYAAGRDEQLNDPDILAERPYLRYVHSGSKNPRQEHLKWHNLILPADDPFWSTNRPPNGYGCDCDVESVSEAELKKYGKIKPDSSPPLKNKLYTNKTTGEQFLVPEGVHPSFAYRPGRSSAEAALYAQRQKIERLDTAIARKNIESLTNSDAFLKFWGGKIDGEFPVGVLHDRDRDALGAGSPVILLSQASLMEHKEVHPEVGFRDYRKIQKLIDNANVWQTGNRGERLAYITTDEGKRYKAVLKRTQDNSKNYFLTLYLDNTGKVPKSRKVR